MLVTEYLEGKLGLPSLAKKHGIKSKEQVRQWVKIYERFGSEGLMRKSHPEVYPVQFKLDVLEYMRNTDASLTDTALQFGINNPSLISVWKNTVLKSGVEALDRPKGRPAMTEKPKKKRTKNTKSKELTREQQLEREVELLRLEVEYLKKLKAFRMDPEGYLEKHKQRYHSSSKKPFD